MVGVVGNVGTMDIPGAWDRMQCRGSEVLVVMPSDVVRVARYSGRCRCGSVRQSQA
jgi:hypothetical protein